MELCNPFRPASNHTMQNYDHNLTKSDLAAHASSLTQTLKTIMENEPPHPNEFAHTAPSPRQASQSNLSSVGSSTDITSNNPPQSVPMSEQSHTPPSQHMNSYKAQAQQAHEQASPRMIQDERDTLETNRLLSDIRECKRETASNTLAIKQLHKHYNALLKAKKAEWMRLRKQTKLVDECGDSLRTLVSQRWTIKASQPHVAQMASPRVSPVQEENMVLQRLHLLLKLKLEKVAKLNQARQQELAKLQRPKQTID